MPRFAPGIGRFYGHGWSVVKRELSCRGFGNSQFIPGFYPPALAWRVAHIWGALARKLNLMGVPHFSRGWREVGPGKRHELKTSRPANRHRQHAENEGFYPSLYRQGYRAKVFNFEQTGYVRCRTLVAILNEKEN